MSRTALLLSGGMDSAAIAFWKRPDVAITVDYGQKSARGAIRASSAICTALNIRHEIVTVDCSSLGSGDLAGAKAHDLAPASEWWPFRNQMLVTFGVMKGIDLGIDSLLVGSIRSDSFHADGKREFYERMSALVSNQEGSIRVEAPAIEMEAGELILTSGIPNSLLGWTHSCHVADFACGLCRGCQKAFQLFKSMLL